MSLHGLAPPNVRSSPRGDDQAGQGFDQELWEVHLARLWLRLTFDHGSTVKPQAVVTITTISRRPLAMEVLTIQTQTTHQIFRKGREGGLKHQWCGSFLKRKVVCLSVSFACYDVCGLFTCSVIGHLQICWGNVWLSGSLQIPWLLAALCFK